jgi:hypothetical protein
VCRRPKGDEKPPHCRQSVTRWRNDELSIDPKYSVRQPLVPRYVLRIGLRLAKAEVASGSKRGIQLDDAYLQPEIRSAHGNLEPAAGRAGAVVRLQALEHRAQ